MNICVKSTIVVVVLSILGYYLQKKGKKWIYATILPYVTKIMCSSWFRNLQFNMCRYTNYIHGRNDRILTYYHDVYDPHSIPMLYVLPLIIKHYSVKIIPKLVCNASIQTFGGTKCNTFNIIDASIQCQYYKIPIHLPLSYDHINEENHAEKQKIYLLSNCILSPYVNGDISLFVQCALSIAQIIWDSNTSLHEKYNTLLSKHAYTKNKINKSSATQTKQTLNECNAELTKRKHYLSGNIYFNWEWFPRMDRLCFLFERLEPYKIGDNLTLTLKSKLNIYNENIVFHNPLIVPRDLSLRSKENNVLNLFYSFRSPYSYLVLERVYKMCDENGLILNIKPVLPSIFRKVSIDRNKTMYILWDCARCADLLGIEFGSVYDIGLDFKLVELCFKLFSYAKYKGKAKEFTLELARYIWSRGQNISKIKNIKNIFTTCGDAVLDYNEYCNEFEIKHLKDNQHLKMGEQNLNELYSAGNWGVPCIQFNNRCVWGQDRLWALSAQYVKHFPDCNTNN